MGRISIVIVAVLAILAFTSYANAKEYEITTVGNAAKLAVDLYKSQLIKTNPEIKLNLIEGIAGIDDFLTLLDDDVVDIVVAPITLIPSFSQSPLLKPFLAQNAVKVRQIIDSEVGAFEKAEVEKAGYRVLDLWHVSSTLLGSKTAIREVNDLKGLKVFSRTQQSAKTLKALGAVPSTFAAAESFQALQAGAIDSVPVPINDRAAELGLVNIVPNYVDRLYTPHIYAVLVTKKRWLEIPYQDRYDLAKEAQKTGENLVNYLQSQAEVFRIEAEAQGASFIAWNNEDVAQVKVGNLSTISQDADVNRELLNLAFAYADATVDVSVDERALRTPVKIDLLFATDRELVNLKRPESAFSTSGRLRGHSFGTARIKLKEGRRLGDDLDDVAIIERLSLLSDEEFYQRIVGSEDRDVVVFIHGYNNSFADSIRRGATIQEDIASNALVISYTWPSDGDVFSYGYDESSIMIAEQNFKIFMDKLSTVRDPGRIDIIAHSMGGRLMLNYLSDLPERSIFPNQRKYGNVIFAASDIATKFFKQKEEEPFDPNYPLSEYADRITIYSSQYDRPLAFSHRFHGNERLGLADEADIYIEIDLDNIDASSVDPAKKWYQKFSFETRHSYVFDKSAGVRELSHLLDGIVPVNRPGMSMKERDGLIYWMLSPTNP